MPNYEEIKKRVTENKSKIVLGGCFALMFLVGFGTGDYVKYKTPVTSSTQTNYTTKAAPAPFLGATTATKTPVALKPSSTPVTVTTSTTPSQTPIDLANCLIKGNASSKIYHVPGQQTYKRFIHPTRCFNTEAEAQAAGFTKAKR